MKKQNKQWTKGKSVGENKKFNKRNLNELNEEIMNDYPNLEVNSTLFSNVCSENAGMHVFSIKRNDELFFLAQVGDKKTHGGELHLRKANDYKQLDLSIAINGKLGLCMAFQFLLEGLNRGLSIEELTNLCEAIDFFLGDNKPSEKRAA